MTLTQNQWCLFPHEGISSTLNNGDGKYRLLSNLSVYFYHTLAISSTNQDHVKGYIDSVAVGTMETVCDIEEPYNITSFITLVKDGKMFGTL